MRWETASEREAELVCQSNGILIASSSHCKGKLNFIHIMGHSVKSSYIKSEQRERINVIKINDIVCV